MKKQLVTFDIKKMTLISVLMLVLPFAVGLALQLTVCKPLNMQFHIWDVLIVFAGYLVLLAVHECVHALAMLIVGLPKKSIRFGAIPKQLMLFCTTDQPMSASKYRFVLLLPLVITGIIPWVFSVIFMNYSYNFLFAAMISGAAGDVFMYSKVRKYPKTQMILDHPKAPAFYLLYEEDELPTDFAECSEEDERALEAEMEKTNTIKKK